MKRIGIDARLYSQTGVGTYLRNLLYELSKLKTTGLSFVIYVSSSDIKQIRAEIPQFIIKEAPFRWHTLSEQTMFLRHITKDSLDLMHFTYFGYPILYRGKFVATVHDLTPLLFKTGKASTKNSLLYEIKHFFFRWVLRSQVERAQAIITPTLTVKKQLVEHYGFGIESKIFPFYEGVGYELRNAKENTSLQQVFSKQFFLYVGNFYPHKNLVRFITAFAKKDIVSQLILVGPQDHFSTAIHKLILKLGAQGKILLYHGATVNDLVYFYKHAKALIHPSLSEGFGLPLIEAAYFKCPIIASDISVMKELLDENCIYFNPYHTEDIHEKILNISSSHKPDYSKTLERCSFARMTKDTLSLYKKVLRVE